MHPTHGKVLRLKESLQWAGWFWSQWKWSRNVLTNYCSPKTSALQMMAIAEHPPLPLPSSLKAGIQFFHFRICTVFSQSGLGEKTDGTDSPWKTHLCHTRCVCYCLLLLLFLWQNPHWLTPQKVAAPPVSNRHLAPRGHCWFQ